MKVGGNGGSEDIKKINKNWEVSAHIQYILREKTGGVIEMTQRIKTLVPKAEYLGSLEHT